MGAEIGMTSEQSSWSPAEQDLVKKEARKLKKEENDRLLEKYVRLIRNGEKPDKSMEDQVFSLITEIGRSFLGQHKVRNIRHWSQDIAQHVAVRFFNAVKEGSAIPNMDSLVNYVYQIAANLAKNYSRDEKIFNNPKVVYINNEKDNEISKIENTDLNPEQELLKKEQEAGSEQFLKKVKELLPLLTDKQREVFVLTDIEGKTYKEAADMLGVKVTTIQSLQLRARRALANLLGKERLSLNPGKKTLN